MELSKNNDPISNTAAIQNPAGIMKMASAFYDSGALFAAIDLGLFGKLDELGTADAAVLSSALHLNERGTRILLDACVALKLLEKTGGAYRNTPSSAMFLVPGLPTDLTAAIRYNRDIYGAWGRVADLARTGRPVERPELHLGLDLNRTRRFVMAMHCRALTIGRAVLPNFDLSGRTQLLDVGGGPGTYSVLLAQRHPELRCTVLDLPDVVSIASELIHEALPDGRVKVLPGDYRETAFPGNNDVVLFSGMLHQESAESIMKLMGKAYESLRPGGMVYVLDMMTDATHAQPAFSALFAVTMALTTETGWVFSSDELQQWMEQAGFGDFTVQPVGANMPHWLARAHKPG
jgi:ubiquinone/menaquinone biosynthesis C-methylase UbiE